MSDASFQSGRQKFTEADEWIEWKVKRKNTVKLLRAATKEMSQNRNNVNIAKLTGISASLVGAGLAIGGAVAAFFTFGASLIVTAVGATLGTAGGITAGGSELCEHLLSKSQLKVVQSALDEDREATEKLTKVYRAASSNECRLVLKGGGLVLKLADHGKTAFNTGKGMAAAAEAGGKTFFQAMKTGSKVLHIGGLAVSVALIPVDIYSLITTSIEVHKGSIPDVVKKIDDIASALEGELIEKEKKMEELEQQ